MGAWSGGLCPLDHPKSDYGALGGGAIFARGALQPPDPFEKPGLGARAPVPPPLFSASGCGYNVFRVKGPKKEILKITAFVVLQQLTFCQGGG